MRCLRWLYMLTFCLLPQSYLSAQGNPDIKFSKITAADFDLSRETFDSSANAVVILGKESSRLEGNNVSGFRMIYTCMKGGNELIAFKNKSKS